MKQLKKKKLRQSVQEALMQIVSTYELDASTKKTVKLIERSSRKISRDLKNELSRQIKKAEKAGKRKTKQDFIAA